MSQQIKSQLFDTPEGLYKAVPTELHENLEFRKIFHSVLEKDQSLQKLFLQMMFIEPKLYFNLVAWTSNPRKLAGQRNWPFILRKPRQEQAVDTAKWCIEHQEDMGINKSRDEGATEIITKLFALMSMIPDSYYIVGSRNKDLVDSMGDPYTLFAKIDYAYATMPPWLKAIIEYDPSNDRKEMQLTLRKVNSVIRGETTNESFSAGRRATAIFLDEFGRVEPRIAESIEGSVHDVSGCVIYGSTHWYGEHHPFNEALKKSTTHVVNMVWYDNPEKSKGLYKTPDYDIIEIVDKDYYTENFAGIFVPRAYLLENPFVLSNLEQELLVEGYIGPSPKFVADKCERLPAGADFRSPWHDREEEHRAGNFRDFVSNVWASPIGSQDSVFNSIILSRIANTTIRSPKFQGELAFEDRDGQIGNPRFVTGGKKRLLWWGPLRNGQPDKTHNYVIGCDPSLGTGNSNSVAAIFDVNIQEIVGMWVCPNTPYELFADLVFALHLWLGEAYVVFENNGGHGINFGKRLVKRGCHRLYTQRTEDAKTKTIQNRWGWNSTPTSKADLLGELGIALSEGLKKKSFVTSCIIHDEDTLKELGGYVYYEDGDIGSSEVQDLKSGARKRHGDRVIAVGLCVLGAKYQHASPKTNFYKTNIDSFEYRRELYSIDEEKDAKNRRIFRY